MVDKWRDPPFYLKTPTILLKDSHIFKIAELKNFLKQKLITNSTILNILKNKKNIKKKT